MDNRDELIDRVWQDNLARVQSTKADLQRARWSLVETERKVISACNGRRSGPTEKESRRIDDARKTYDEARRAHEEAKVRFKGGVTDEQLEALE